MSTKKVDQTTIQYDPGSKNTYDSMQTGIGNSINSYMNAAKTFMPLWMQQSNQAINQIGNRMNDNLFMNARAGGFSGNLPSFMQANLARNMRATGSMQANAFLNSRFQAANMQMQGTQMAEAYRPLQTGSTTTEQVSGTGTWLPQLLGAGLNIAGMAFNPASAATKAAGMATGGGGGGGMFGSGPNPNFYSSLQPQSAFNSGYNPYMPQSAFSPGS